MLKRLISVAFGLVLLFATGCGKSSRPATALPDSGQSGSLRLVALAADGTTAVPDTRYELRRESGKAVIYATGLEGVESGYFKLLYPADECSPAEVVPGALLPEDTVTLAYTDTPGEVIAGFARIRADERGGITGSGAVFEVTLANVPFDASRAVKMAPSSDNSRVNDLRVTPLAEDQYSLEWTERNNGDYDLSGAVSIADITPIAQRFGNSTVDGDDDFRDLPVDGNGDGAISIADITPLAQNFGARLDGYHVYRRSGLYAEFEQITTDIIPRYMNNGEGILPTYAYVDGAAPTGVYISYEVRGVDSSSGDVGIGSRANEIDPVNIDNLMNAYIAVDPTQMSQEELAEVFESYLFLFGGTQLGVVDSDGTELSNSVVEEENLMSLRHEGALQLAQYWQTIEPYTLGEVLQTFIDEMVWEDDVAPTMAEMLALQQEKVNEAWANLAADDAAWAIVLQFNQGSTLSSEPPTLTEELPLNVFQAWALTVSFMRWADTDGKVTAGYGDTLTYYPNMPGTHDDSASFGGRLYNQWSSYSFVRRVLHAGAGALGTAGLAVLMGNPVSLTAVAGVAVFSFFVKPPAGAAYDVANNALSNYETPVILSTEVDVDPIPDTTPPRHGVVVKWSASIPPGGDGGPSYEIVMAESTDGPWQVVRMTHNSWSGEAFNNYEDLGGGQYSLFTSNAEQGKTYVFKVRRRDIRWGPDNVVNCSNHVIAHVPAGPSVIGLVHDTGGTPLPNILASTSDGEKHWSAATDGAGHFKLVDLTPGQRVISFSARGFATHLEQVVVSNAVTAVDVTLPAYVGDVTALPDIQDFQYFQSTADETAGLATLTGTVMNLDGPQIIIIQNGNETIYQVDDYGNFSYRAVLEPGENEFQVRAVNALGGSLSDTLTIDFIAVFVFRATLTWNMGGGSDIDLYTRDPSGETSYYSNKTINSGSLDVDNTSGYGPENFTCAWIAVDGHPEYGTYQVGVNYYSDHQADPSADPPVPPRTVGCGMRLILNPQTDNEQTLFYSGSVSVPNGGSDWFGGGGSWWNPVTVTVNEQGVASAG